MDAHKNEGAEVVAPPAEHSGSEAKTGSTSASTTKAKAATSKPDKAERPEKDSKADAKRKNNVRKLRTERMMSKAELARRAGISVLTVDRVERGMSCRMDTKRKILEALGLKPQDRVMVFGDAEDD